MPRTRLLVAAVPPMLYDILQVVAEQEQDLEIVAHVGLEADLGAAVDAFSANVVLRSGGDARSAACEPLLWSHPQLRVLTLTDDGRIGYLDRLMPQRTVISDLSAVELIDALRGVGRFGAGDERDTSFPCD